MTNKNDLALLLNEFINKHALENQLMPAMQTQGIVTAMAAAPFQINPSEWLGIFWGEQASPFTHQEQLEEFAQIIVQMWNHARQSLLSNTWQWPLNCELSEEDIVNQATRNFCEGLLQGWQITKDDWQIIMPEDGQHGQLVNGVLISISMLFNPEGVLASHSHEVELSQFKEVFEALPMMLAGLSMHAEMLSNQSMK